MTRVLLIDDDAALGEPLGAYMRRFGIELTQALRPSAGLALLQRPGRDGGLDAVVLDVMLPEMDGFEVCRAIRRSSSIPIIMLTARGDVTDRVVGLELGADDYLPKPFEPRELVARLQTVLRRQRPQVDTTLRFDGLLIEPLTRRVQVNGQPVDLTGSEFDLLLMLAREPGKAFSRDDILSRLRGHDAELFTRAVDIVVSRLRKKLEPLDAIKTLRHTGYTLALPPCGP
jgi:OmpR family response regulator RpaB